jgi:hypothetical protein
VTWRDSQKYLKATACSKRQVKHNLLSMYGTISQKSQTRNAAGIRWSRGTLSRLRLLGLNSAHHYMIHHRFKSDESWKVIRTVMSLWRANYR